METETLSKYEQERPNTDDISNEEYKTATEIHVSKGEDKLETKDTKICHASTLLENDSDEDVEEEEKLILSPTHSENDSDEDHEVLSAEENGKDEESEEDDVASKTEINEKQDSEIVVNSASDGKAKEQQEVQKDGAGKECDEISVEKKFGKPSEDIACGNDLDKKLVAPEGNKVEAEVEKEKTLDEVEEITDIMTADTDTAEKSADDEEIDSTAANAVPNEQKLENNKSNKCTEVCNKKDEEVKNNYTEKNSNNEGKDKTICGVENMDTSQGEDASIQQKDENDTQEVENPVKSSDRIGSEENSLLKETLTKSKDDSDKTAADVSVEMDADMDEMEDFDPSLLCPDVSMEVEENPVITDNDAPPPDSSDGSKGMLSLCEPIFSTFVDEITGAEVSFGLSLEEISLREQTYGQKNPVQFTKIHCTACNVHLGSALDSQGNRFVHPLLKVLICKKCYHFYTSGEFEKDEDGSELYCRWCGQGGQVMCCTTCEMVFCKKCIRINFDKKKMNEIRDSDDWKCFGCNPSQLIHLRIHCSSFMDYVQREMSRVSSVEDQNAFLHTDYSQCCLPTTKKKAADTPTSEPRRKRRKNAIKEDPDYDPFREADSPPVVNLAAAKLNSVVNRCSPKSAEPNKGVIAGQSAATTTSRVGSVSIRPMGQLQRPRVQVVNPATPSTSSYAPRAGSSVLSPRVSAPVLSPRGVRPATPRAAAPSVRPSTGAGRPPLLRPLRPVVATPPAMKHEWFEKTVRAAARVNSNLSYTLTQLNRAQANATSVEGLAVVHNKLQEILSTSINSLIQIRKNLRSEFIVGIKNIRFPCKNPPAPGSKSASAVDDDVIIVSPSSSPPPPPATSSSGINLPPSVSFFKRTPNATSLGPGKQWRQVGPVAGPSGHVSKGTPSSATTPTGTGRPFLRVKSFSALQNVSSECITIPDDPPPLQKAPEVSMVVPDNSVEDEDKGKPPKEVRMEEKADNVQKNKVEDKELVSHGDDAQKKGLGKDENNKDSDAKDDIQKNDVGVENNKIQGGGAKDLLPQGDDVHEQVVEMTNGEDLIQLIDTLDPVEKKKLFNTKIVIEKSDEIDELAKSKFGLQNGSA